MLFTGEKSMAGVPIKSSINANQSRVDFLDLSHWGRAVMQDIDFYDVGGQTLFPIYGASGGIASAYIFYFVTGFQVWNESPRSGGVHQQPGDSDGILGIGWLWFCRKARTLTQGTQRERMKARRRWADGWFLCVLLCFLDGNGGGTMRGVVPVFFLRWTGDGVDAASMIRVTRETHEAPEAVQERVARAGGSNRYGEANFRWCGADRG